MTNREIVAAFAAGATKGKANSMRIDGDTLYSYATPIAFRNGPAVIVTQEKHSMTTSHHQSALRGALVARGYEDTGHRVRFGRGEGRANPDAPAEVYS